ncbi:MAG: thiamine biosynthesis protein ThiS [Verrucomicrobiaceae bacterium TMED137]|nr:MAG: thiamine biosynthesis protein ThiS [Verrucomicrobiaceae bacterium TMED137]HAE18923.1 thiamine biosynthesis protein ThiS [Verrucomicrobiales bacterium]HAN82560.1 thiamine biosynthesis protein ThiS [Verrucomicrobiales bacterium]HBI33431.1 thiamine biosynthesis protein ThiS [Verrucomicrobiales bacterium]HCN79773.1 thiamine biosynthesis protein ThiS [Verrucomicrobiales bacterium]
MERLGSRNSYAFMNLTINGETRKFNSGLNIQTLLVELGLADKPVVVELNQKALAPSEFESQNLSDNDQLEIITIAAGG